MKKKEDRSKHLMKTEDLHKKLCESLKIDPNLAKIGATFHDAGHTATNHDEHADESR